MKPDQLINIIIPVLSGIGGIAGAAFWFQRWVGNVDDRLDKLTDAVNTLANADTISRVQLDQIQGQFKQTQICMDNTNTNLAKLSGNLDALWRVLKNNENIFVPTRLSDRNG